MAKKNKRSREHRGQLTEDFDEEQAFMQECMQELWEAHQDEPRQLAVPRMDVDYELMVRDPVFC